MVRLARHNLISPNVVGFRCEILEIVGSYVCEPRDHSSHTSGHLQAALASSVYPSTYASALYVITTHVSGRVWLCHACQRDVEMGTFQIPTCTLIVTIKFIVLALSSAQASCLAKFKPPFVKLNSFSQPSSLLY